MPAATSRFTALSSTTRIRGPSDAVADGGIVRGGAAAGRRAASERIVGSGRTAGAATGSMRISNQNVEPRFGSLATPMTPPISATSWRQMASPRPVPPYLRVVKESACVKALKIWPCASAAMPMPVSLTSNRSLPSAVVRGHAHHDLTGLGELDGISRQIDEDLPQPHRITAHGGGHRRLDLAAQFEPLGARAQ